MMARVFIPEAAQFLGPTHVAAINAMSEAAVAGHCLRLRHAGRSPIERAVILKELDHIGAEARRLWPGVDGPVAGPPRGLWPVLDDPGLVGVGPSESATLCPAAKLDQAPNNATRANYNLLERPTR
jgi:hypothetical protein